MYSNEYLKKLKNYLQGCNLVDSVEINKAIIEANKLQQPVIAYLAKQEVVSAEDLVSIAAKLYNVAIIDLSEYTVDMLPLQLIAKDLIVQTNILPLQYINNQLDIVTIDPGDIKSIDIIKFHTELQLNIFVARYDHLQKFIKIIITQKNTEVLGSLKKYSTELPNDYHVDFTGNDEEPLVRFVNNIIEDAILKNTSDIHFEVYERYCRIRFRQDGILTEITKPPVHIAKRLVARLKIMAQLDISEQRIPQDGHCKIKINEHKTVEMRVSSCPTISGEKIVLRLINSDNILRKVAQLDFNNKQYDEFVSAITKPQGLVLVTGPTGSGKTITLYAALQFLNKVAKNIITVEDPVEINLANINQVNVNNKAGLTFFTALRAFLRQDPDIIMIGEIRDLETAEIAIKAAQTGHLVISTLHTNSAVEALTRLRNMGIVPYNIISSVTLITAQRLVRVLCPHCKKEQNISNVLREQLNFADQISVYTAAGCARCANGYYGRIAIHEVLKLSESLYEPILQGGSKIFSEQIAKTQGFVGLKQIGLEKVAQGITSLDEIYRVIG